MSTPTAVFAVPGDLESITGGYLYDRRLLESLRARGRIVRHIALPDSFPAPTPDDQRRAEEHLAAIPAHCPVIIDGLAFGALEPSALAAVTAPIIALIHHPLAEERGIDTTQREALYYSERANLARAAHVVVTSPHTAQLLTSNYGVASERITVARPGSEAASGPSSPSDPPLILAVGIQVRRKGHDLLLRALDTLVDRAWEAVIVGDARDAQHAEELRKLAHTPGLAGRVHLAGCVSSETLAGFYRRASVFALATRYEGYGIVFDEAMRHGLPIVSCAVGAVPDTVEKDAGQLVPPEDPKAFAAALARVLEDAKLRAAMAAASQRAGAALPGWDDTAQRVADVIDRVTPHA